MRSHWEELERTFRALAYIAKSADPHGIEVCFSSSPEQQTWFRHTTSAIHAIRARLIDRNGHKLETTEIPSSHRDSWYCGSLGIVSALNRLLDETESRRSSQKERPTTILVLTDRRVVNTSLDWGEKLGSKVASFSNNPLQGCSSVHFTYFGAPTTEADALMNIRLKRYLDVTESPGSGCNGTTQRHVARDFWTCCYW